MTLTQFASLGQSAFNGVVNKRQKLVAAKKVVDALMEACKCDRGCQCEVRPLLKAAESAEGAAYADLRAAEAAYSEYTAIRNEAR